MDLRSFFRIFLHVLKSNIISIIGLSVGMMITVFSINYIVFENSFDTFHKNKKRIFHVSTWMGTQSGDEVFLSRTHYQLKLYVDEQVPQVERSCRLLSIDKVLVHGQEKFKGHEGLYVDGDYFSIFDYDMIAGQASCLEQPEKMILTRMLARKLFGSVDCLGSDLEIGDAVFTVGGIIKDPPANSNIRYDYLLPMLHFVDSVNPADDLVSVETYILTHKRHTDLADLEASLNPFFDIFGIGEEEKMELQVERLTGLSPYSEDRSSTYLLFISISLLVLVVSVVNFINSFATGCELRIRDIGMRKAMGASRILLIRSMVLQSLLMSLIAAAGACILTGVFMGAFRELSGVELTQYGPGLWKIQVIVLATAILTGWVAGIFPAVKYASLKENILFLDRTRVSRGTLSIRNILVIFQYSISAALLIILFIFMGQLQYLSEKDPGYIQHNRMLVRVEGSLASSYQSYIEELRSIPSVLAVSGSILEFGGTIGLGIKADEESEYMAAMGFIVEDGFFRSYGIRLLEGSTFEETSGRDPGHVIIDRSTARILGMDQPVGKRLLISGREMRVIGLVDDADLIALRGQREPFAYTQLMDRCEELIIHYIGEPAQVAAEISRQLKVFDPEFEFNYRELKEARNLLYEKERKQVQMILFVVVIAVIITMAGAYAMTRYQAGQRAKEICIRKVMGATVIQVLQLSVKEMIWMTGIAFLVASPLAYFFSAYWLQNFTHRIHIEPWAFLLALLILSTLILVTVLSKAWQAALMNPAEKIRRE